MPITNYRQLKWHMSENGYQNWARKKTPSRNPPPLTKALHTLLDVIKKRQYFTGLSAITVLEIIILSNNRTRYILPMFRVGQ